MPIEVRHDSGNADAYKALIALLQEQARRRQEAEQAKVAGLAEKLNPGLGNGKDPAGRRAGGDNVQDATSAPSGRVYRTPAGRAYTSANINRLSNNRNDTVLQKAALDAQTKMALAREATNRAMAQQQQISARNRYSEQMQPLQEVYAHWANAKIPDEVAQSVAAGRAEYTPKQRDERNKLITSITEAQNDPNLTDQQRLQFLAQQYKALYDIDSQPIPTTPDKWKVSPQEQFEKDHIVTTGPDGLPVRRSIGVRNGMTEYKLDEEDAKRIDHYYKMQENAGTLASKAAEAQHKQDIRERDSLRKQYDMALKHAQANEEKTHKIEEEMRKSHEGMIQAQAAMEEAGTRRDEAGAKEVKDNPELVKSLDADLQNAQNEYINQRAKYFSAKNAYDSHMQWVEKGHRDQQEAKDKYDAFNQDHGYGQEAPPDELLQPPLS